MSIIPVRCQQELLLVCEARRMVIHKSIASFVEVTEK